MRATNISEWSPEQWQIIRDLCRPADDSDSTPSQGGSETRGDNLDWVTYPYVPGGPFSSLASSIIRLGMGTTATVALEYLPSGHRVTKIPNLDLPDLLEENRQLLLREIEIYNVLDANPHPCFLRSLGSDPANFALYLPLCRGTELAFYFQRSLEPVTRETRLKLCFQLASAVKHLHDLEIYLCDLSIGNILIDREDRLTLLDFGCSSIRFLPPERTAKARFTIRDYRTKTHWLREDLEQIDVLALGSFLYMLSTGKRPFEEVRNEDEVVELYTRGVFPDTTNILLGDLIRDIWTEKTRDVEEILLRIIHQIPLPLDS